MRAERRDMTLRSEKTTFDSSPYVSEFLIIPFPVHSYREDEPQTVQVVRQGESTKEGMGWERNYN
jgi:hypothetical protein